jgi:hypothetical protein
VFTAESINAPTCIYHFFRRRSEIPEASYKEGGRQYPPRGASSSIYSKYKEKAKKGRETKP